jgi:hypothetical protein
MEKTIDTTAPSRKMKGPPPKLPKVKKPPTSVMNAVVKRAESKSKLAKFDEKTAPLLEAKREKELLAKRAAAKAEKLAAKAAGLHLKKSYWEGRKDSVYLKAARDICARHLKKHDAVLDVGSNRTPTITWHRKKARRLVSVDLRNPYRGKDVESIAGDFFDYPSEPGFELVTCFQVLEHVPDAHAFAQKLLATGRTCIVSVPYKWPKGKCKWHIHDPVDQVKMLGWFGKAPLEIFIAREETADSDRLICVYEGNLPPVAAEPVAEKPRSWAAALAGKLDKLRGKA